MPALLSTEELQALMAGPNSAAGAFPNGNTHGKPHGEPDGHPGEPRESPLGAALGTSERSLRAPLPGLERIHARFAHHLREAMPALLRRQPEVEVGEPCVQRYSEFLLQVAVPTNFNRVSLQPLRGHGLIVCDPALVFAAVDGLFGGSGQFQTRLEGRDFSATEKRVIQRLVGLVLTQYTRAWAELLPLQTEHLRSEMLPHLVPVAAPGDWVVSTRFTLQLGESCGTLSLCWPHAMLEPVRAQLLARAGPTLSAADPVWANRLQQEIQSAEVEVVAELAQASATVQQLLAFKPGDFIELDMHPQVQAKVNGVPVCGGHYGTSNSRYAIKVEHMIQHTEGAGLTEKQYAQ